MITSAIDRPAVSTAGTHASFMDHIPRRPVRHPTRAGVAGLCIVAILMAAGAARAAEEGDDGGAPPAADSAEHAVARGSPQLKLRPRYAYVDQQGKAEPAQAWTLRTLLGWQTQAWQGFSGNVQLINVGHAGETRYATSTTRPSPYPVVRDPDSTDFNHLHLDYAGWQGARLRAGRQELLLDNERMVGLKNFSQTMQVFDAAMLTTEALPAITLTGGYVWGQRTTSATHLRGRTWLGHALWKPLAGMKLSAYVVAQNQPDTNQVTGLRDNSNRILGVRLDGAVPVTGAWSALYTAEAAQQDPHAGGDARIDARYSRLGAGLRWNGLWARLDQEVLGSNGGRYAFQTPLGSTHTFQGWADQFTTTPAQGLRDRFASVGGTVLSTKLLAEFHQFHADQGSIDFGHEFDLRLTYPLTKQMTGRFELADYHAGDAAGGRTDLRKLWVTLLVEL